MKSFVIFVVVFVLLNEIGISKSWNRNKKKQTVPKEQTSPQVPSSSNAAVVDLFDVLDSNKDGYVTMKNLYTFCNGAAYKNDEDDERYDYKQISRQIGQIAADRLLLTMNGQISYPPVNLQELNQNKDYDLKALKSVLGINDAQAKKILDGKTRKTAEEVAEFIRTKNFAPDDEKPIPEEYKKMIEDARSGGK